MRPHGHAHISRSKPQAQGICDRCGFPYSHKDLMWQFDWVGARLQNLRILVCRGCRDKPQENIRTIVLPPDPMPIMNPRPEAFPLVDNPISGIGWSPRDLFSLTGPIAGSAFFGTLTGGGGPDAVFYGGAPGIVSPSSFGLIPSPLVVTSVKLFSQSATLTPSSTATGGNSVGINWSNIAGAPLAPASLPALPQQAYVINQAIVTAPVDAAFLGSSASTTVSLDGSNDGVGWTLLASGATIGSKGETVTLNSSSVTFYGYHRVRVTGDGTNAASIAAVQLFTTGPSIAQTGSELGA